MVFAQDAQAIQIKRVDVARDIALTRHQLAREISDATANLEDFLAAVRSNYVGDPAIIACGLGEAGQNLATVFVDQIDVIAQPESEDRDDRAEAVAPVDFFALAVSAAAVT